MTPLRQRLPKIPEDVIHRSMVDWLHYEEKAGRIALFFHCPNGARRTGFEQGQAKRWGMRAGVPDLVILHNSGLVDWVEVKSATGRLSPEQTAFSDSLQRVGAYFKVVRSLDELMDSVKQRRNIRHPTFPELANFEQLGCGDEGFFGIGGKHDRPY